MVKILKIILLPIVIVPMVIMSYVGCIMTWGLTSFQYNFNFFWTDYWNQ